MSNDQSLPCVTASCPRCDLLFPVVVDEEMEAELRLRLTDEEREAIGWAIENAEDSDAKKLMGWPADEKTADTLRNLLERLGGER